MMAERAPFRAHRRTGPAVEIELEHLRSLGIRKEAELLDGRSEERDDARADARGHVHHARVAGDHNLGAGETGTRFLQREFTRRVHDAGAQLGGELAIAGAAERDESVAQFLELRRQRSPVPRRPAFGRVRGTGRESRERLALYAALAE